MPALPQVWLSDPAWCAMDATARGFHAQLVLLAAREGGSLADDEALWRRWLGIPEAGAAPALTSIPSAVVHWVNEGAPSRLAQLGGLGALTEHYWVRRWLPMLRMAWQAHGPGRVSCEAARVLSGMDTGMQPAASQAQAEHPAAMPAGRAAAAKRKAAKPSAEHGARALMALEDLLGADGPVGLGWTYLSPLGDRLVDADEVLARWHVPASRAARLNLWTVGLAALACGPGEEAKNRAFLSSLIQKYGERKVSAAVGEMGGRSVPPADPRAFLRGILRRETEGNVAAQNARELRASIPL